ncbi:hypothetical protein X975_26763, partial [Stegodyphus mimosarum]
MPSYSALLIIPKLTECAAGLTAIFLLGNLMFNPGMKLDKSSIKKPLKRSDSNSERKWLSSRKDILRDKN